MNGKAINYSKVAQAIREANQLNPKEMTYFVGLLVNLAKDKGMLHHSLTNLSSKDWMTLYKAVLEVEAGL